MFMLIVLIIADGWGIMPSDDDKNNVIKQAKTPNFDKLLKFYPSFLLTASGSSVGYINGELGDSERGHLILGAGRTLDKLTEKPIKDSLSEVLSKNNLKQLYISETEKFVNISYFFGGFRDKPLDGADWTNIPSLEMPFFKNNPEMSAKEVNKKVVQSVIDDKYNFIAVNIANPDMVAHEADFDATIKAVQITDACVGEILDLVLAKDGVLIFTSDHGNAEEISPVAAGEIMKPHTYSFVPGIIAWNKYKKEFDEPYQSGGTLADVAPTILKIFKIRKPREMTGRSLI